MKRYLRWMISLLCLGGLFPVYLYAASAKLTQIQFSGSETSARLTLFLTQPAASKVFTLQHPDRLVVDMTETQLAAPLPAFSDSFLKKARVGHPVPGTLRLVFDLDSAATVKTLKQSQKVIVDIYQKNPVKTQQAASTIKTIKKPLPSTPKIIAPKRDKKIFVVVIDPGHGGKDPGAIGENGTKEKDVVLGISRRLAALVNQQPNMRAELTRSGDYFVPLRQRLRLARKGKADLFIAIHADSFFNGRSSGASVYALSHRGATSEAARWLARRENDSELGGVDLSGLEDKSHVLRSVLIDLAQTATITDSLRLGTTLLNSLERVTNLHYTRVEQAPFVVLKSPDIPSVLVETGFISNPQEEKKLRDADYQDKMAQALFNGIQRYVQKYAVAQL